MSTLTSENDISEFSAQTTSQLDLRMANVNNLEAMLKSSLETSADIVEVTLTVTDFRPVLKTPEGDRGTQYILSLANAPKYVTLDEGDNPQNFKVKSGSGPITFKIRVVDASPGGDVYYPLGIAFKLVSPEGIDEASDEGAIARKNFPLDRVHSYGEFLFVTDLVLPGAAAKYKFSVFFQRAYDGELGIIDPGVETEN